MYYNIDVTVLKLGSYRRRRALDLSAQRLVFSLWCVDKPKQRLVLSCGSILHKIICCQIPSRNNFICQACQAQLAAYLAPWQGSWDLNRYPGLISHDWSQILLRWLCNKQRQPLQKEANGCLMTYSRHNARTGWAWNQLKINANLVISYASVTVDRLPLRNLVAL